MGYLLNFALIPRIFKRQPVKKYIKKGNPAKVTLLNFRELNVLLVMSGVLFGGVHHLHFASIFLSGIYNGSFGCVAHFGSICCAG